MENPVSRGPVTVDSFFVLAGSARKNKSHGATPHSTAAYPIFQTNHFLRNDVPANERILILHVSATNVLFHRQNNLPARLSTFQFLLSFTRITEFKHMIDLQLQPAIFNPC